MSDDLTVTGAVIAKCCSITRRQHNNLVKQGVMPGSNASKKYSLVRSMRAFVQYRVAEGPTSAAAERLKHMQAKTRKLDLENAKQSGEIIEARAFADSLDQLIAAWRSALGRIAKRAAPRAEHRSFVEIRDIIDEETRVAGQEMAEVTSGIASMYQAAATNPEVLQAWLQCKATLVAADLIALVEHWADELARANNPQLAKLVQQVEELRADAYRRLGMLQSKRTNGGEA